MVNTNMNENKKAGIENAFKAGVWYSLSAIAAKSISIITTPIFTRMMSTSDYGIAATFSSWYSIFLILCTANLSYSHSRAKIDFPGQFTRYVGATHTLSYLITGVLSVVAILFLSPVAKFLDLNPALILLLLIYLFSGGTINISQSENRYCYDYKKNIFITLFTTVGTVLFTFLFLGIIKENRYYAKILGFVVPSLLLAVWIVILQTRKRAFCINLDYWKYGLRISMPLIFHTISLNVLTQSDRIVINKVCGSEAAGIYSLIYQYAMLINIILNAINESWNPWFHDIYNERRCDLINKNITPLNAFVSYICIGCITVGPEAIMILGGEKYISGQDCIFPIVLGLLAQFLFSHYIIIEVHHKQTQFTSLGTIIAAAINLGLNVALVPFFGFTCAAYTTLIAYLVLYLIHLYITRHMLNIHLYNDLKIFGWFGVVALYGILSKILYRTIMPRYALFCIVTSALFAIYKDVVLGLIKKKRS